MHGEGPPVAWEGCRHLFCPHALGRVASFREISAHFCQWISASNLEGDLAGE